jgi:adenylylsulfate kinase
MAQARGAVYWITGLSGAGKTTIGRLVFDELRRRTPAAVFLDGDILREVFGNDLGHSRADRLQSAMRNARLCRMLAEQGIDVVCATISLFRECQEWNRAHIARYFEVYLRVPMEVLVRRDQKQLYSRALRGEITDVIGVDLPVEEPQRPDLVIDNDGTRPPGEHAAYIWKCLQEASTKRDQ